jgi:hypothetical protein
MGSRKALLEGHEGLSGHKRHGTTKLKEALRELKASQ